jgi:D-alanyl-lipoteichoic acid acyltransferase DltB (MBOAT superfamily)
MPNCSIAYLLLVSYAFYWCIAGNYIACLIIISILTCIAEDRLADIQRARIDIYILRYLGAFGQLGLFKFSGILPSIPLGISQLGLSKFSEIILSIHFGLSFYTLASITYVFDIYRGKSGHARSIWEYALFESFSP